MAQASAATAPGAYNGDYPLKDIPAPHPHDVLCGRGGGTNNHIGNSHWRMLVAANKQLYITLPKRQKMLLSRSIVNAVRSQNPPGRFLQKDSKSNKWFDVGDQRAQEKTSQALREGAPDIRKKVAAEKDTDSTTTEKTTNAPGPKPTPANDTQKTTTNGNSESKNNSVANGVASNPNVAPAAAAVAPAHAMPAQQQQQQQPMMAQQQAYMMNGGMPMHPYQQMQHQMQQQHGYPMMHPYQQMQQGMPMQGYPPMVMNEQGMMVPAYPGMHPQLMQQQMQMQQHMAHPQAAQMQQQHMQQQMPPGTMPSPQSAGDSEPIPYAPSTSQHQQQQQQQQQQQSQQSAHPSQPQSQAGNPNVPNFDEFVSVAPPDGGLEPAGLSYGSVMMTENEMRKLESGGTSFGTAMSYKKDSMPEPVGTGILENAPGASFGDVSMMSVSTRKLEDGGFSFGSAMSFGTNMVDGGLEAIGASFGSLSLDTRNRETLFHQLELAAAGPEIPPMLNTTKSTANLLDCSDSEEELEDESQKHEMARKKSQAWERMQHSVANNLSSQKSNTGRSETSKEVMPPPVPRDQTGTDISVPSTTLFSQLSAYDDGDFVKQVHHDDDALPPPPAPLQKNDDDDEKLDMYLIHQQSGS